MENYSLRDFIETKEHWIFSVVSYDNDDGVKCLLRYVPSQEGERVRDGIRFKKMGFDEAYDFIRQNRPEYLDRTMVVPFKDIVTHYRPEDGLKKMIGSDAKAKKMAAAMKGIDMDVMGITGSKLIGLGAGSSDVDFVVYGKSWFKAREALAKAISEGKIDGIDEAGWKKIYEKRKPELNFEEFYLHERRKGNRCILDGALSDLLYVRERGSKGPSFPPGKDMSMKTITARVTNADLAFDSPAVYKVDHPDIGYVLSFTHTYAGQALEGEVIEARGRMEDSDAGKVLVVGTSREPKGEWIRSLTLLGKA